MGGKGSGRPTREKAIVNNILRGERPIASNKNPRIGDLFIPNHSGDHSAGTVLKTPVNPHDIVNKQYADSVAGTPAGNDTEIQFNDSGVFGADNRLKLTTAEGVLYTQVAQGDNRGFHVKSTGGNNSETKMDHLGVDFLVSGSQKAQLYYLGDLYLKNTNSSIQIDGETGIEFKYNGTKIGEITSTVLDMNTHKITSLTDPTANQDAATKKYVDDNSATPGGADTNVQYNNSGDLGGGAGMTFNKATTSPKFTIADQGGSGKTVVLEANNTDDASYLKATTGVPASDPIGISATTGLLTGSSVTVGGTNAYSMFVWFKSTKTTGAIRLMMVGNYVWGLEISNGRLYYRHWGRHFVAGQAGVCDGQWHLLGLTYDNGAITLYKDNEAPVSTSVNTTPVTGTLVMGHNYGLYGTVDEPAFWNKALTLEEKNLLYNSGNGLFGGASVAPYDTNLLSGWHFDEGTGTSASAWGGSSPMSFALTNASWVTGKVTQSPSDSEVEVIKVTDGVSSGAEGTIEFGNDTSDTILNGGDLSLQIGGVEKWNIDSAGDLITTNASQYIRSDSEKLYFGAADDASITYDGTDLIINSDDVGSGGCKINTLNVRADGTIQPVQLADASAANDSIYYSTTASKLVYKDSGGTVNNLY